MKFHPFILIILLSLPAFSIFSQEKVPEREYIVDKITDIRKIHTPNGIEELKKIKAGGVDHWLSIRGLDKDNPVMLFIHGGPGSPMMPLTWAYQKPWEDFYTVVQYEQRGAGKNYLNEDRDEAIKALNIDQLVKDAEDIIDYLRAYLKKDKVIVVGFSYGSGIGLRLVKKRPDAIYAYGGIGQSSYQQEGYLAKRTMEIAVERNNQEAIADLKRLEKLKGVKEKSKEYALGVRKWVRQFDGGWYGKPDFDLFFSIPDWAPEYTQEDVNVLLEATQNTTRIILNENDPEGPLPTKYEVPIFFFMGLYDLHTPYETAKTFLENIQAPMKKFISFKYSSHFPMFEEPGRLLHEMNNHFLPIVEKK